MSLFKRINDLLEEIDYPVYISAYDHPFVLEDGDFVMWNQDNNLRDLDYRDGETYSGDCKEVHHIQDDCTFVNYDDGCGNTITGVFKSDKRVTFDE